MIPGYLSKICIEIDNVHYIQVTISNVFVWVSYLKITFWISDSKITSLQVASRWVVSCYSSNLLAACCDSISLWVTSCESTSLGVASHVSVHIFKVSEWEKVKQIRWSNIRQCIYSRIYYKIYCNDSIEQSWNFSVCRRNFVYSKCLVFIFHFI